MLPLNYFEKAPANSGAGIGLPKHPERTSAHPKRFFCARSFLAGVTGAPSGAPLLWGGKANSAASATLLIGFNGGGLETNPEEHHNAKHGTCNTP